LYAVTDLKSSDRDVIDSIERALRGGADVVQLRSKSLPDSEFLRVGAAVRKMTRKYKRLFIVNDRLDLMLVLQADGVHLGQEDLPITAVRKLTGRHYILGSSTHNFAQAIEAEKSGADYVGFGPIFATPTKADYAPVGLNEIRRVSAALKIPVVCIGGVNHRNVTAVRNAGGRRIAVVRAIFGAPDPAEAARRLKEKMGVT